MKKRFLSCMLSLGISCIAGGSLQAGTIDDFHHNDGAFTTGDEWFGRSTVHSSLFPVVGNAGGAVLVAEGSSSTLYLMYDYFNSPNVGGVLNSVTIFFNSTEIDSSHVSYAIKIAAGINQFQAFEKSAAVIAPVVNGGLDLSQAPWTALSTADLLQANFHTSLKTGISPTSSTPHLVAEFDLSNRSTSNPNGLYSPDPQFWSGSGSGTQTGNGSAGGNNGVFNTVFASELFTGNADGTLKELTPLIGSDGTPILQPVPEPGSLALLSIGAMGLAIIGRARRQVPSR